MSNTNLYIYHFTRIVFSIPCFFGNILTITAISKFESLQTPCNMFILSLAIADVMMGSLLSPILATLDLINLDVEMPFKPVDVPELDNLTFTNISGFNDSTSETVDMRNTLLNKSAYASPSISIHSNSDIWIAFCSLSQSVLYTGIKGNLYSILLIAIDRFIAIEFPLRYASLLTTKKAVQITVLCWIVNISFTIWTSYTDPPTKTMIRCFTSNVGPYFQTWILGTSLSLATVGVIVIYSRITLIACAKAKELYVPAAVVTAPGNAIANEAVRSSCDQEQPMRLNPKHSSKELSSQIKITRTMLLVVGLFLATNIPIYVVYTSQKISFLPVTPPSLPYKDNFLKENNQSMSPSTGHTLNDTFSLKEKSSPNISFVEAGQETNHSFALKSNRNSLPKEPAGLGFKPPAGPNTEITYLLLLYLINTWANPLIYAFRSRDFQRAFRKLLRMSTTHISPEQEINPAGVIRPSDNTITKPGGSSSTTGETGDSFNFNKSLA